MMVIWLRKPDPGLLLFDAAASQDLVAVKSLLKQGAPINYVHPIMFGWTPLIVAISYENKPMAISRYLVEAGADVNIADEYGRTPLMHLVDRDDDGDDAVSMLKMLIAYGANVEARDKFGTTIFQTVGVKPHLLEVLDAAREAQNESSPATRP
jgi:ankyrin repeat protein